jgi:4-hydroxybenzoate polyprenyltransferase
VRLSHPFPSVLDGLVTALVAVIAGADALVAVRLGLSMVALQASIGILNDLIDAPRDADRTPPKPIPAGLVRPSTARAGVLALAVLGVGLAVPSGAPTVGLAVAILGIGYGYDRFAKGTAWSWLPFAVGIPLLPVYGWLGGVGELPSFFAILVPVAVLAGAALAIANALADLERDTEAGVDSIARRLGRGRAWLTHAVLLGIVIVAALASLSAAGGPPAALLGATGGAIVIAVAAGLGRVGGPRRRQRAWEGEAVGLAVLAVAWIAAFATVLVPGAG